MAEPNPEISQKETTDDPKKFINDFLESDLFRRSYGKFYEGKKLAPDVTEEEKRRIFYDSDDAKVALVEFAQRVEGFIYNPDRFTPPVAMAARTYIKSVEDYLKMYREGLSDDDIIAMDKLRYTYHQALAKTLCESGFVPSEKLGRGFARIILISKGLDTFDDARVRDADRLRQFLA